MGDHSGQVEPSASSAYTAAGSAPVVAVSSITCWAMAALLSVSAGPECTIWYMRGQAGRPMAREATPARAKGADGTARERLLESVIRHFAADGLADQSLRRIAEAIGTSHRMLLYHFGSKDGLLLEVVRAVEARTEARLVAWARTPAARPTSSSAGCGPTWRIPRSVTSSACSSRSTGGRCRATSRSGRS